MTRLFYNFFIPEDKARHKDIAWCLKENLSNEFIDEFIIFGDPSDFPLPPEAGSPPHSSLLYINCSGRPTYEYIWNLIGARTGPSDINIFLNSDCYIDNQSMSLLSHLRRDDAWCLSRWDMDENLNSTLRNIACSQDCWITKGVPKKLSNIAFGTGRPGCDNRFAYELHSGGYSVKNPSKTFKVYHYHLAERPPDYGATEGKPKPSLGPRVTGPTVEIAPTTIENLHRTSIVNELSGHA